MLPRQDVRQQVSLMQRDIRRMAQEGTFSSHQMLPSLRKLAQDYGISHNVAAQSLKVLMDEGVIYSVPRVGIFVGRPKSKGEGVFLLVLFRPATNVHCAYVQMGFEERIAQLGGTSLTLDQDSVVGWNELQQLPPLAGVFEFVEHHLQPRIWTQIEFGAPVVEFGELQPNEAPNDRVYFDNVGGGRQAAQHLLGLGHHKIAFLGLHGSGEKPGDYTWSQEREKGWREALLKEGYNTQGLLFQPQHTPSIGIQEQVTAAYEAAKELVDRTQITAVVAANIQAARGLCQVLQEYEVPTHQWPALVCFDTDIDHTPKAVSLTTLRLSWEDIGRAAADLLWARNLGQLDASPQEQLIPMRLIKRLSSQSNWAQRSQNIEDQAASSPLLTALV